MWDLSKKIILTGIRTEEFQMNQDQVKLTGKQLEARIAKRYARALAIRFVDAGSCNGCELEISAINNPYYNLERFGIHFVASPRHADLLLVTGPVVKNMQEPLLRAYEAMPDPKLVVAVGDCAQCGGIFKDSYAVIGGVNNVIPVNVYVKGCPPTPLQIMSGLLTAIKNAKIIT